MDRWCWLWFQDFCQSEALLSSRDLNIWAVPGFFLVVKYGLVVANQNMRSMGVFTQLYAAWECLCQPTLSFFQHKETCFSPLKLNSEHQTFIFVFNTEKVLDAWYRKLFESKGIVKLALNEKDIGKLLRMSNIFSRNLHLEGKWKFLGWLSVGGGEEVR